jgi:hypothetical protein
MAAATAAATLAKAVPTTNTATIISNMAALAAKSSAAPTTKTPDTTGTPTTGAKSKAKTPVLAPSSDLAAMIVQAAVLASNVKQAPATPPATTPAATTPTDSRKTSASAKDTTSSKTGELDLTTLIAQANIATSNASAASASATTAATAATAATTATASATAATAAANAAQIAETTALASTKNTVSPSTAIPTTTSTKEKKSTSTDEEGSFIQSDDSTSDANSSPLDTLTFLLNGGSNSSGTQQLTTESQSKKLSLDSVSGSSSSSAGTANVEKQNAMNTDFDIPQILSATTGPSTALQQSTADVHIQLSSNNDFEDALTQVMHVAQLSQTTESRPPTRIAMELQTPPGAIVNVYVSRQNDQWRAQLSTNDPQALSWVQGKMSSLNQSSEFGVQVRWLPPQMESGTAPSTNSGNDSNLAWDRGGQGQQGQQQSEERSKSRQQNDDESFSLAGLGTNSFMTALSAVGSAS